MLNNSLRLVLTTNHLNLPTNQQWIDHIRSLIDQPLSDVPFDGSPEEKRSYIDAFADEYANRRATDRPFLAYLLGITLEKPTPIQSLDQQLWWMIQSGEFNAEAATALIEPADALMPDSDEIVIEYRTMVELCGLHALWIIANRTSSEVLIARCLSAAAWHTRELQPDNAINRPWGAGVFIALAHQTNDAQHITELDTEQSHLAHLHAQTLIHNTSVSLGVPDILSALVLRDVVEQLGRV